MASGKTTIGKLLSESLELPFYDLDSIIEQEFKTTINEIFVQKGELFFRKKEREILESFKLATIGRVFFCIFKRSNKEETDAFK